MTKKKEIEELVKALEECRNWRLFMDGGYPAEIQVVGRHIVIADEGYKGQPELTVIPLAGALSKFRRAKELARELAKDWDDEEESAMGEAMSQVGLY